MAEKSRTEIIRQELKPRERLFYLADIHGFVYVLPMTIAFLGLIITIGSEEDFTAIAPYSMHDFIHAWIGGAKQVNLGLFMIAGGAIFTYRFRHDRKHMIQMVTNLRIFYMRGVIMTTRKEIFLHRIEAVRVQRGTLLNRLLGRGAVVIQAKDKKQSLRLGGVSHPERFVDVAYRAIERYSENAQLYEKEKRHKM